MRSASKLFVSEENLAQVMTSAVDLHQAGKLADARRIYHQVLSVQPRHSDALSSLAMIECERNPKKALKLLQQAISISGSNPGYHMNHGYLLEQLERVDDAIDAYRQAITLQPGYRDPYYNLGDLYLKLGQPGEAIAVFDACMASNGRDFHALAYKAHALRDAGDLTNADSLLDHQQFVKRYKISVPDCFENLSRMNQALAQHVKTHPSLQANVRSTMKGDHTGELLAEPKGPMAEIETVINAAVAWYCADLPDLPGHPFVQSRPKAWRLTSWGVVLKNRGYERSHIHPNGWLSGVFYLQLPDVLDDPDREPEGWLEFGRPTKDLHVRSEPQIRLYKPEVGNIILFPSYFYHGTIPFTSSETRICISFDAEPII